MTSNNTPPRAAGPGIWANLGIWIAFGLLFGVVVGSFFPGGDVGLALGAPLGLCLGIVAWAVFIAPRRNARGGS